MNMLNIESLKSMVDEAKVMVVPKTDMEKKIYEALSNRNWGASSTLLNSIAADTYDYEKYGVVMKLTWQTLDSPGRNWRAVFKALSLLEHLIKNGSERVIEDCRDHMHKIRTLIDFNYSESGVDRGSGVREKSKQLIELLGDNERIREERDKAKRLRDKFVGIGVTGGVSSASGGFSGGSGKYDGFGSSDLYRGGGGGSDYPRDFQRGSERPGRYSDRPGDRDIDSYERNTYDPHVGRDNYNYKGKERNDSYSHDEEPARSPVEEKPRSRSKDKIQIKLKPKAEPDAPAKRNQGDFLGDDFFGGGGATTQQKKDGFDAFGGDPFADFNPRGSTGITAAPAHDPFFVGGVQAPAPAPAPSAQADPFFVQGHPPRVPPAPFDPFAAPSVPSPPYAQVHAYGAPPPVNFINPTPPPPPPPSQPTQTFLPQPTGNVQARAPPSEFGDFQAASKAQPTYTPQPTTQANQPTPEKKLDSWGGLVDLANLSITDNKADIAGTVKGGGIGQASSGPSSDHVFADLDAFGRAKTNGFPQPNQAMGLGGGYAPKPPTGLGGAPNLGGGSLTTGGYNAPPQGMGQYPPQPQYGVPAPGGYGYPNAYPPQMAMPPHPQSFQPQQGAMGGYPQQQAPYYPQQQQQYGAYPVNQPAQAPGANNPFGF